MRAIALSGFLWLVYAGVALAAALHFPALTGRVVDEAHILAPATIASLTQELEDYERGTGNQLVVVTLSSLQGVPIEDYGYKLGRNWAIGQAGKNNGVLLIVAPNERKVRIEVGYGNEPLLTDAASSQIVQGIILPAFRAGHMQQGIVDGSQAIIDVLGGKSVAPPPVPHDPPVGFIVTVLFLIFYFWLSWRHPLIAAALVASGVFRSGSGRSGGGGFSGGGGSFGGGGASGSW